MEKDQVLEKARPTSTSSDDKSERAQVPKDPKWEPGFGKRFPWIGFGALVMVLACAASSVVVLVTSDHVSQTKWPERAAPNVLINVMNSLENICFAIAIGIVVLKGIFSGKRSQVAGNGVAIAWWRKTLKGSSIADLHRSWTFSTSVKEMVFSLKYFNLIALAALTAKFTLIDSSLMQRATDTYLATDAPKAVSNVTGFVNLTFPITGTVAGFKQQPGLMEHWMGDTLKLWSKMGGIYPNQWHGCEGSCFLHVPGIGFAFECDDQAEESINFGAELKAAFGNGHNASANVFDIVFNTKYYGQTPVSAPIFAPGASSSYIQMNVTYTNASDDGDLSCPGTKYTQSCRLWPSIVNYPVLIQNSTQAFTVSIGGQHHLNVSKDTQDLGAFNSSGQQQNGFEVLRQVRILESHNSSSDPVTSSLAGIQLALQMYIQGRSILTWDNSFDGSFIINQMGHSANFMTNPPSRPRSCAYQYTNPVEPYSAPNGLFQLNSIIGKINQIMFGLGTDVSLDNPSNNHNDTTRYDAIQYEETIHYLTHYPYMWGAVAATIICVLLVLPVYWGFWELGRKVTLNPFEIAYAFRSPVVGEASTAATDELIQEVGSREIRYGNIIAGEGRGQFGVDEPKNVVQPPVGRASWRVSRQSS